MTRRFQNYLLAIGFFLQLGCRAEFTWVQVGVDGLTCSQCCRSVELSLRRLEFVQEVKMDLEKTEARITFKPGLNVSIDRIARAVVDAGFSVRYLKAGLMLQEVQVTDNSCYRLGEKQFQFVRTGSQVLNGDVVLTFLGRNFLSKSVYKTWKETLKPSCAKGGEPLYFVTL